MSLTEKIRAAASAGVAQREQRRAEAAEKERLEAEKGMAHGMAS